MSSPACTVVLELSMEGELPTGRATAHGHRERTFTGWLGLMGAVQALIADGDDEQACPAPGDH